MTSKKTKTLQPEQDEKQKKVETEETVLTEETPHLENESAEVSEKKEQEKDLSKTKEPDVLEMLHGEKPVKKAEVEKNNLPVKLLNEQEEKTKEVDAKGVGKMHDLLEVARQHALGYQSTWDASLKAYARHMGFPSLASMNDCKAFIVKWGAKLKD